MTAHRQDSRLRGNDHSPGSLRGAQRRSNLPGPGKQSGYLLLPVAIAIALIGVIGFMISSQSAIEVNLAAGELETARAGYVAQAGLQHALRHHAQQGCGPYTDLASYPFGGDLYDTKLTGGPASTAKYTALADQDTWIRDDLPTNNYAADTKLHIRFEGGITERPLYRYDLSTIPAKAPILSATAHFYVSKGHPEGPVDIHRVTADWTEAAATWDSLGDKIDGAVLATIPAQPLAGGWVSVNLTAQVQAWVNGEPNYGITLNSTSEGTHGDYASRESATEPYLEVVVGNWSNPVSKLRSKSLLASGGGTLVKRDVTLRQNPDSYREFQPGPGDGIDTYLKEDAPDNNYGASTAMWLQTDSGRSDHPLLRFNLGAVPYGARVERATLELYQYFDRTPGGEVGVHRVSRAWAGGENDGSPGSGASWNLYDGSNAWSAAGGDFDAVPIDTATVPDRVEGTVAWDVTPLVRGWVSGEMPNYGLLLRGATGIEDMGFYSSENTDAANRPKLTLTYRCACGEICAAPQGSGNLLMVVINPTTLVPEDQQAKDLFESWGYTVSVISESANQTAFDAGFAANDVVFVSETVNSNTLGTRLKDAPIGIVTQDGDYNDSLGFANNSAFTVGASVDITDTEHFITRPFAAGELDIYAASMEQLTVSGSVAAEAQVLAQSLGVASLVALEKGAAIDGGTTAGRRVMLPLGTRYRFNWDHLNANGRLLVHRALQWGLGADNTSLGNVLLVVVDPGLLTAQEDAKKALIEGWGYTVNLIDEAASQAEFGAAVALNDVAYVAEDITSGTLGTKLRDAAIGVVIEEEKITDEFGICSGETTFTESSIEVTDNTHYITQPFSLGTVAFASAAQPVGGRAGTLAPGLEILALQPSSSTSMLDVIDTGGVLFDSGTAAGRRVKLPWGGNDFDFNALTDDGRTIMRRSIEWGAGLTPPPPEQQLLFVVPSPGSLGPTDAAKQALFESWGYTVNQIDDDAPLADFQAAITANSVAYVSATAVAASVGSKLFKANIGVVNANTGLHDDFGFSTVRFVASTNAPLNTVASHYITQPFGGGQVTLYTSDQASGGAVGTLAADLDQLGSWSSGALAPLGGLVTLDAGAMTSIGENTPARRAQMPWDSLDVSTLSADGLTILQRSLEWAEGANIDLSPIAHWKLDETSGLTAVDSEGGHDGTLNNFPTPTWTPGLVDGGLDFDGVDDEISVGAPAELDNIFSGGGTVTAWINPRSYGASGNRIVDKWRTDTGGVRYGWLFTLLASENTLLVGRAFSGQFGYWHAPTNAIQLDTWQHVAVVYDDSSDANDPVLYINGVPQVLTEWFTPSGTPMSDAGGVLTIGDRSDAGTTRTFDGIIDDVRLFGRPLGDSEIADMYAANAPLEPGYYELHRPWSASTDDTWETVDLAPFGVPGDAVVEVAILNADGGKEQWGGVRAVGSALDRRFLLHEAEAGGVDALTLHVQADAAGRIQHYSSKAGDLTFVLLGYWNTGAYVELFDSFSPGDDAVWQNRSLATFGVGPDQVTEIVLRNSNTGAERQVGVRAVGSSINRRFDLHEAESGGIDAVSLMVQTNASSQVQVYAETVSGIGFQVVGYWSTPPGSWTELGGTSARSTPTAAWGIKDLSPLGVPPDSVTQFVITNDTIGAENTVGARAVGSSLDRFVQLQEAEAGGSDLVTMHANVDAGTDVEWYSESGTSGVFFYPVGAWLISP